MVYVVFEERSQILKGFLPLLESVRGKKRNTFSVILSRKDGSAGLHNTMSSVSIVNSSKTIPDTAVHVQFCSEITLKVGNPRVFIFDS